MTARPNWTLIGTLSLISFVILAAVLYFLVEDSRWIAGLVLGLGVIDAAVLALVVPRLAGEESAVPIRDGDWGVAPPSEPGEPGDPTDD